MKIRTRITSLIATAVLLAVVASLHAEEKPIPRVSDERVQELKDLRFGMFICWSFSTFSGQEWTRDIESVDYFKATGCDTDQWARTAKEAGMGYILFLTKHHDGFCLWDTKTTERKVTKSPLGVDVLAKLRKSCDKYGIKLALYFSEGDWTWPGPYMQQKGGVNPEMKKAQLKELLTEYGPVEYIWFDHAVGTGGLSHTETIRFVKSIQPDCFVGFNHGDQTESDIRLGEMGRPGPLGDQSAAGPHMRNAPGKHYRLAEFTYPIQPNRPTGAHWFYSLPKWEDVCMPAEDIYRDYLGAVKYGNVYALDAGPMPNGKLRPIDVKTLQKVGRYVRGEIKLPPPPPRPISQGKPAKASGEWENGKTYGAAMAFDGNPGTRWGAPANSRSGWLSVNLGEETSVSRIVVDEGDWGRVLQFAIEVKKDGEWEAIVTGKKIGANKEWKFTPVKGREFRLNVLKANEVPTIHSVELYEK